MSRYSSRRSIYKQTFEGSDNPQRPELHWFKYDKAICSLVEKRCSGTNKLSSYEFVTESECSAAMSSVQAAKLDAAFPGNGSPKVNKGYEIVKLSKKVEELERVNELLKNFRAFLSQDHA